MRSRYLIAAVLMALTLSVCGKKGDLVPPPTTSTTLTPSAAR